MITVIAAVGENGEYGKAGGLPWTSPQELDLFWRTLSHKLRESKGLMVGAGTWFGMSYVLQNKLLGAMLNENCRNLYIYDPKDKYGEEIKTKFLMFEQTHGMMIHQLMSISPGSEYFRQTPVVCIGGAHLITHLLDCKLVKMAQVSRIKIDESHGRFSSYYPTKGEINAFTEAFRQSLIDAGKIHADPEDSPEYYTKVRDMERCNFRGRIGFIEADVYLPALTLTLSNEHKKRATISSVPALSKDSSATDSPLYFTVEQWDFDV
ncbi:dihydrofolate reductase-thymidylate synthase [Serratia phage Slocum]|nr:dihydrofolate reductase-thymidylate synthase [Serratia phage Slocum]